MWDLHGVVGYFENKLPHGDWSTTFVLGPAPLITFSQFPKNGPFLGDQTKKGRGCHWIGVQKAQVQASSKKHPSNHGRAQNGLGYHPLKKASCDIPLLVSAEGLASQAAPGAKERMRIPFEISRLSSSLQWACAIWQDPQHRCPFDPPLKQPNDMGKSVSGSRNWLAT